MMLKRLVGIVSCVALVSVLSTGCGHDEADERLEERQDLMQLGGKADIPSWLRHIPVEWGCDQHIYSFPGKVGYRYTFTFDVKYRFGFGAVLAVYDAETGQRVAIDRTIAGTNVALEYTAEKSVKYLVAVYSVTWFARGDYTLKADCELTKYCVEWQGADFDGNAERTFYAVNVDSYEEGKQLFTQIKHFSNEEINPGSCASQPRSCGEIYAPVCSDRPVDETTHDNICELKVHVRTIAGETGEWKGAWELGACAKPEFCGGIIGIPCSDGFKCILDGDYPDAGGQCMPILCTFNGQDYVEDEEFSAGDSCNTCSCFAGGQVYCTKRMCPIPFCDPKSEWYRDYVSTDPEQCKVIKYSCPVNTTYFSNTCGCGCEQDASCPQWVNCMPPAPCDVDALRERCPYTQIAW
ncbi:MAG: hypothetical protein JRH20_21705 [Deltaproteobacteria bacterium]|nr:hypothetical protein [Deltaproteobacteria bacterium]